MFRVPKASCGGKKAPAVCRGSCPDRVSGWKPVLPFQDSGGLPAYLLEFGKEKMKSEQAK